MFSEFLQMKHQRNIEISSALLLCLSSYPSLLEIDLFFIIPIHSSFQLTLNLLYIIIIIKLITSTVPSLSSLLYFLKFITYYIPFQPIALPTGKSLISYSSSLSFSFFSFSYFSLFYPQGICQLRLSFLCFCYRCCCLFLFACPGTGGS